METILIQVNNNKAYKLLQDLEALDIIKVLRRNISQQKLSQKYRGVFSKEDAKDFNKHVQEIRKEWASI